MEQKNMVDDKKKTDKRKGVLSIFEVEQEYPKDEKEEKKGGRSRPDIVDPYGWCSHEDPENKKVIRIYSRRQVLRETIG